MAMASIRSLVNDSRALVDSVLYSDQLLISQVIERRNIKWLCHFTPRKNLEQIKKEGLKTRDFLSSESIVTDPLRYDQNRNAICLTISKPNKWMFNKKQEQGYDLCLLLIDPVILYRKDCLFFPHNAATASYRFVSRDELSGEIGLENMFANPVTYQKSGKVPQDIFRQQFLKDCETTSDQAEVQCLEHIDPKYIKHIFEEDIPLNYDDILRIVEQKKANENFDSLSEIKMLNEYLRKNLNKDNNVEIEKQEKRDALRQNLVIEPVVNRTTAEKFTEKISVNDYGFLDILDKVVDKTLEETDEVIDKTTDKIDRWLEEDEEDKQESSKQNKVDYTSYSHISHSSGGVSSGDGCLGVIILIILVFLFVL